MGTGKPAPRWHCLSAPLRSFGRTKRQTCDNGHKGLPFVMRVITMAATLSVLALAGCAQQRIAEANTALTQRIAECKAQYPDASKNFLLKARCDEPARRAAFAANNAPGDLVEVFLATRADVAAKADRGEITREEANLRIAQTQRELADAAAARRNAALAAMPSPPVFVQPAVSTPTQTTCTRFGNTVNCNSY